MKISSQMLSLDKEVPVKFRTSSRSGIRIRTWDTDTGSPWRRSALSECFCFVIFIICLLSMHLLRIKVIFMSQNATEPAARAALARRRIVRQFFCAVGFLQCLWYGSSERTTRMHHACRLMLMLARSPAAGYSRLYHRHTPPHASAQPSHITTWRVIFAGLYLSDFHWGRGAEFRLAMTDRATIASMEVAKLLPWNSLINY